MRWILSPALALALSACADFGGPVNGRDGQPSPEEMRLQRIESGLAQLNLSLIHISEPTRPY